MVCLHFFPRTFQKMSFSTLLLTSGWWTAGHSAVTSWWGPMLSPAWDVSSTPPQTKTQTTGPQQVKEKRADSNEVLKLEMRQQFCQSGSWKCNSAKWWRHEEITFPTASFSWLSPGVNKGFALKCPVCFSKTKKCPNVSTSRKEKKQVYF